MLRQVGVVAGAPAGSVYLPAERPLGLALCGGPLGSRQTFPVERQLPCRRLCVVKVTAVSKYLGYQADNRQQVDESPGERVGSLLPSGGKLTPRGRKRGPVTYIAVGEKHDHHCAMGQGRLVRGSSVVRSLDNSVNLHTLTRDLGQNSVSRTALGQ